MGERIGWAVQIMTHDGETFMACGSEGVVTPVWPLSQRKRAVAFKNDLQPHLESKCRVVRVRFSDPVVIEGESNG